MYLHLHVYYLRLGGIEKQAFAVILENNSKCLDDYNMYYILYTIKIDLFLHIFDQSETSLG